MAQGPVVQDLMHYDRMVQKALRGVIRAALERAAAPAGLPGQHHFYVSFRTRAPGVSIPPELVERYPDEMTIVLQHQYWDLTPLDTGFSVSLSFGGQPKRLAIPYAAITRFHDPSVQFMLQFEPDEAELQAQAEPQPAPAPTLLRPARTEEAPTPEAAEGEAAEPPAEEGPKIVSLDQFRKK